jgi:oxygen-independent coproporphyrinogen-3 oxidase
VIPRSLYVHVPFCLRRCSYCDFAVTATREPPVDAWLRAITAELRAVRTFHEWPVLSLDTVYIGGGTPSLLPAGMMAQLRDAIAGDATWAASAEWTVEANPETLTYDLARDWRDAGVNRLSIGAQTFHEPTLQWMGRMHGTDGPARAIDAARNAGITDVSIDLIFGLPLRLGRDWASDLDRALALDPTHVSLYGLTAEKATPLGRWVAEGREVMTDEESYEREYRLAVERLTSHGFEHYEVSNFSRPGHASRHNSAYWQNLPYIGLGPGAHSYIEPRRFWNVRDWAEYRARIEQDGSAVAEDEIVDDVAQGLERVWLGLRARPGLDTTALTDRQRGLLGTWSAEGLLDIENGRALPTTSGWLVLDRLAVELSAAGEHLDASRSNAGTYTAELHL